MMQNYSKTYLATKQARLESTARIHSSKALSHRKRAEPCFDEIESYLPQINQLLPVHSKSYLQTQMTEIRQKAFRHAFLLAPLAELAPHLNWLSWSWLLLLISTSAQHEAIMSWLVFFAISIGVESIKQLRPVLSTINPIKNYECYTFQLVKNADDIRKYDLYLGPRKHESKPVWVKDGALYAKRATIAAPFKGIALYESGTAVLAWSWIDTPDQCQIIPLESERISPSNTIIWEGFMRSLPMELLQNTLKPLEQIAHHYSKANIEESAERKIKARLAQLKEAAEIWEESVIDASIRDKLMQQLDLFLTSDTSAPKGMLLYGPSGSGKTTLARTLAKSGQCTFISAALSDLKGEFIGQTASKVKEAWKKVCRDAPCIFFIDECEGVFAKRGGIGSDNFSNELVQTFLAEWEYATQQKTPVWVIGATNRRENLDEAALSRFNLVLEIPLPDAKARKQLLENSLEQRNFALPVPTYVIKETGGMSARDVVTLASSAKADFPEQRTLDKTQWLQLIQKQRNKHSTSVQEGLTWDDLILPEKLKHELTLLGAEIRYAEIFKSRGLSVPKSMLLYGSPGTGKTQIARVIATQSGIAFMAAATADMKAGYTGQSGQKVKEIFERARSQAPCILFIDEIDIIAPSRMKGSSDGAVQEILGQLLQEMDGVKRNSSAEIFVIGASNCPDHLDAAVASRFERKIEVSLPDKAARIDIVKMLFRKKPYRFDMDEIANVIASHTEGYSGRSIQSIVSRTERYAIRRSLIQEAPETATILRSDIINSLRDERSEMLKQQRQEAEANPLSSFLKEYEKPSMKQSISRFSPAQSKVDDTSDTKDNHLSLALRKTKNFN